MSILSFLLKPKKEMRKANTKMIKTGKYTLTSHAQNRLVQDDRNIKKCDMLQNLFGRSMNSRLYTYRDGTVQYDRINQKNRTITYITAKKHYVKTIRKYHKNNEAKEFAKIKERQ